MAPQLQVFSCNDGCQVFQSSSGLGCSCSVFASLKANIPDFEENVLSAFHTCVLFLGSGAVLQCTTCVHQSLYVPWCIRSFCKAVAPGCRYEHIVADMCSGPAAWRHQTVLHFLSATYIDNRCLIMSYVVQPDAFKQ